MIVEDIKNRMKLMGITNSQLAEWIGSNPAQLSLFFKNEGASLKIHILQKCLDELGIDTAVYTRRYNLALSVAEKLNDQYSIEEVSSFSKEMMAKVADNEIILQFIDADATEFAQIKEKGVVDIESTYPFFRTMVLQLMGTGRQLTKSSVNSSLSALASTVGLLSSAGGFASISWGLGAALGSVSIATLNALKGKKTATFPLLSITEYMLNKKGKRTMEDKDLEFLYECSNELLVLLADTIVYDQKGKERFTEGLTSTKVYKDNYPENMISVIPEMIDEIQHYGGNTIINAIRNHGVPYREILINVAKRLKVNFNNSNSTELIEQYLLQRILLLSVDKMTEEDVRHLSEKYSKEELKDQIKRLRAGTPLFIKLTSIIVLQLSKRFAQKAAIGYLTKFISGRAFATLAGPIAWVITTVWATFDIAGPAYRVLVPCTITIAYMRQIKNLSEEEFKNIFE